MAPILEVRNATKRFPGVLANDQISFALNRAEILAFLGENGAGKSTLMNILYGLYSPDEGEIEVRGQRVEIEEPKDAIELGIGMVHQHFQLVPVFTVAENIVMGTEPTRPSFSWRTTLLAGAAAALLSFVGGIFTSNNPAQWLLAAAAGGGVIAGLFALILLLGWLSRLGFRFYFPITALGSCAVVVALGLWRGATGQMPLFLVPAILFSAASYPALTVVLTTLDRRAAVQRIRELSEQYGLAVDPDALVEDIPVGVQQRVEILKILYREAEILILDEPTGVLTPQETEELFEIMHSLEAEGKSIIFISHKLKEVMAVADRVIVLRDGKVVNETAQIGRAHV